MATLEARLAKVELCLGDADPVSAPLKESFSPAPAPAPTPISDPTSHNVGLNGVDGFYEGSSSFLSQSVQASEVAQRTAASETPEAAQTISESFSHLESLLRPSVDLLDHSSSSASPSHLEAGIAPLPVSLVIAVLRRIKCMYPDKPPPHLSRPVLANYHCQPVRPCSSLVMP